MRAHAALVSFCESLAASGFDAMRFDYSATGDSSGETGEATADEWIADVGAAAREVREITGVRQLLGVGVRLGATILATAAYASVFDGVALWEPVVRGATYLERAQVLHRAFVLDQDQFPTRRHDALDENCGDVVGNWFPESLRASIERLNLHELAAPPASAMAICLSSPDSSVTELHQQWTQGAASVKLIEVDEPIGWLELTEVGKIVIARDAVQALRHFLVGCAA